MMAFDKKLITDALRHVRDPSSPDADLIASGRVAHIAACDGFATIKMSAAGIEPRALEALGAAAFQAASQQCAAAGEQLNSLTAEYVDREGRTLHLFRYGARPAGPTRHAVPGGGQNKGDPANAPTPGGASGQTGAGAGHQPIRGLQEAGEPPAGPQGGTPHIIAVGAGKGGVGKSAVAVNLAVGLARKGLAVGLMDGDIYGPSIPTMLGLHEQEQSVIGGKLQPFYVHGVKTVTIGKLVDPDRPLIWRGPMAHGAFKQLVEQTDWGELDYLIIDLPPGTGDVPLTMSQMLQLTGAVIVCTPQRVAQDDALRAVRMFQQLKVEVLGVVENMSVFVGDDGKEYDIFGRGGAEKLAARLNLPFLGAVPITMALRENSDKGDPSANFKAGTPLARALDALVENFERQVSLASLRQGQTKPTLKIS